MQHLAPRKQISWCDVVQSAERTEEPLQDVHVVTAKSEYVKFAYDIAADTLYGKTGQLSKEAVQGLAHSIIDSGKITIREHVRIDETGITVCINANSVDSDSVVWRSLDMLADALDQLVGDQGTVFFGEKMTFPTKEIPWLTEH